MYMNKSYNFFSITYYNGQLSTIGWLKTDIPSLHIFRLHLNTPQNFFLKIKVFLENYGETED